MYSIPLDTGKSAALCPRSKNLTLLTQHDVTHRRGGEKEAFQVRPSTAKNIPFLSYERLMRWAPASQGRNFCSALMALLLFPNGNLGRYCIQLVKIATISSLQWSGLEDTIFLPELNFVAKNNPWLGCLLGIFTVHTVLDIHICVLNFIAP